MGLHPTGLFETHPSNGDRIRRGRQANLPGLIQRQQPAADLFSRFDVVAMQVSLLHYADDLRLPLWMAKLQPVRDSVPAELEIPPVAESITHAEPEAFPGLKLRLKSRGHSS